MLAVSGGWSVGGVRLTVDDLGPVTARDYDGDGTVEPVAAELDGLVTTGHATVLSYYTQPSFTVHGLDLG